MDFTCGGNSFEQQIVEAPSAPMSTSNLKRRNSTPTNVSSGLTPALCGCVKDSNFDEEDSLLEDVSGLSIIVDEDEDDEEQNVDSGEGMSESAEIPVKMALDTIQQTLDDVNISEESVHDISLALTNVHQNISFATSAQAQALERSDSPGEQTPNSRVRPPSLYSGSLSPSFLNPLSTDWRGVDHLTISPSSIKLNDTKKSRPTLDTYTSSSLTSLFLRMEEGFRVRLTGGPISCLAGEDEVLLYLHPDHSRLCVESATAKHMSEEEEKKHQETVDFWIELPVNDILRLESNRSPKCFSIVLEKEDDCLIYYDFETPNAIDREVLISTIMIVLDQSHNSQRNIEWTEGGTLDQPIPCSPSLEQLPAQFTLSLEHPATLSPGAALTLSPEENQQLSPSKRTQIYNSADRETETSLVIHLEDLASNDQSEYWYQPRSFFSNRDIPSTYLHQKSTLSSSDVIVVDDTEEVPLDFKPSVSSTHLPIVASSSQLATAAWCGGNDICTNALRDIADTCTGIFAMKKAVDDNTSLSCGVGSDQLALIEEFIAAALGAPASVYTYLAEGDVWNIETSASLQQHNFKNDTLKVQKDSNNSLIRNRASLLNAQAARLRTLRNEMTFAAALKQSRARMQFVQTVRSFDDVYHSRKASSPKLRVATEAADRFHASPLLKSVVETMTMHDPNGNTREIAVEDVAYYDSDPEDVRPRTTHNKAPRRVVADRIDNELSSNDCKPSWRQQALSGTGFDEIGSTKRLSKKIDEELIVEIVHAMTNERFTLMWHPTQNDEDSNLRPVCVKVWIESGVYLTDGTFLLPKLSWSNASQEVDPSKSLERLDLLDICRICATKKVDRQQHPFAVTQKSFFIETQREFFVFQAQSSEERDRIVYGLKLVVARLASLLMLRDIRAAEEFFGSIANMVPGEAPAWTRGSEQT